MLHQEKRVGAAVVFLALGVWFVGWFACQQASADERYGSFSGKLVAEFLSDGVNVQLVEALTFTDSKGRAWSVPAGSQTNGASIPQFLWIGYPPFTGKYRIAAVIHDHYCVTKDRPWQQVHRVFYDSMRAAGVDKATAKAMYAAVYAFGPRWIGTGKTRTVVLPNQIPDDQKQSTFDELKSWIEATSPTPSQIRERIRALKLE